MRSIQGTGIRRRDGTGDSNVGKTRITNDKTFTLFHRFPAAVVPTAYRIAKRPSTPLRCLQLLLGGTHTDHATLCMIDRQCYRSCSLLLLFCVRTVELPFYSGTFCRAKNKRVLAI